MGKELFLDVFETSFFHENALSVWVGPGRQQSCVWDQRCDVGTGIRSKFRVQDRVDLTSEQYPKCGNFRRMWVG